MHAVAGLILAVIIFGGGAALAVRMVRGIGARLPAPARAATARGRARARKAAARAIEPVRDIWAREIAQARAQNWLDGKRARRDARAMKPASGAVLRRLVTPKGSAGVPLPQRPGPEPRPGPAPARDSKPDPVRTLRSVPAPPPPNGNGRTPNVTTGTTGTTGNGSAAAGGLGAGADMLTAVHHLVTHVMSSGIEGKQRGFSVASESLSFMADQFISMAHRMAEPGQDYPASAYEPWLIAAAHLQAAAMAAGEGGSVIQSIRSMTIGEAAQSSMHVPHNSELNKA